MSSCSGDRKMTVVKKEDALYTTWKIGLLLISEMYKKKTCTIWLNYTRIFLNHIFFGCKAFPMDLHKEHFWTTDSSYRFIWGQKGYKHSYRLHVFHSEVRASFSTSLFANCRSISRWVWLFHLRRWIATSQRNHYYSLLRWTVRVLRGLYNVFVSHLVGLGYVVRQGKKPVYRSDRELNNCIVSTEVNRLAPDCEYYRWFLEIWTETME